MSSDTTITLTAHKRDLAGEKPNALRAAGQLPAVIHDHGKDSVHIVVDTKELSKVYAVAGRHHPVTVSVDGKNLTTIIKEVTYKPATNKPFHSVLQAVKANEAVKAEVPLKLVGEIPAEKASLLVLHNLEILEVEALPKDLVDVIEVDAGSLVAAGDKLTVADIKAPTGVVIKTDPEQLVAAVETPKDQIAEADAAAEELAADASGASTDEAEATPAAADSNDADAQGDNPEK